VIKETARELRKGMTPAEKLLWEDIRRWKICWKQFQRQKPISVQEEDSWLKRYVIPDFICLENKLIIELDWSIHNLPEVEALDEEKEILLKNLWYKILRFKNKDVFENKNKVLEKIAASFL
jgi:very-short-patch-repair endonuclease